MLDSTLVAGYEGVRNCAVEIRVEYVGNIECRVQRGLDFKVLLRVCSPAGSNKGLDNFLQASASRKVTVTCPHVKICTVIPTAL